MENLNLNTLQILKSEDLDILDYVILSFYNENKEKELEFIEGIDNGYTLTLQRLIRHGYLVISGDDSELLYALTPKSFDLLEKLEKE